MKEYDVKSVVQAISNASPSHLALVSFLVLPVVMNYWLETLIKAFPDISSQCKVAALFILVGIYVFCLWWLIKENAHQKLLERKRDQIIGKLVSSELTNIGFARLRKTLTGDATDEEIITVIEAFPKSLRYVQLLKRDENKNLVIDAGGKQVYIHGVALVSPLHENNAANS